MCRLGDFWPDGSEQRALEHPLERRGEALRGIVALAQPPFAVLVHVRGVAVARGSTDAAVRAANALLRLLRDDPRRERTERVHRRVDLRRRDREAGMA